MDTNYYFGDFGFYLDFNRTQGSCQINSAMMSRGLVGASSSISKEKIIRIHQENYWCSFVFIRGLFSFRAILSGGFCALLEL